jgi:hypothetical protein
MKVRLVAGIFCFFCLASVQGPQVDRAYAWCCPCSCMPTCTCAGRFDSQQGITCKYCLSSDPILEADATTDKNGKELSLSNDSGSATIASFGIVQRVTHLKMGQPCLRDKVALSLLGANRDDLKFELMHFDEKSAQNQTLVFQVKSDRER